MDVPPNNALSDEDAYWLLSQIDDPVQLEHSLNDLCGVDRERRERLVFLLDQRASADRLFAVFDSGPPLPAAKTAKPLVDTPSMRDGLAETPTEHQSGRLPLQKIGPYALIRLVGRGGMGNVFQARDPALDRDVALKVPRVEVLLSPDAERRFVREARAAARLDHPHLVPILQVGSDGPYPFIASQWCDRGDLATWMRHHPDSRSPQDVASFMASVADGIQHCHDRRIVHLDLKPSNILLSSRDDDVANDVHLAGLHPKVTDFGLARLIDVQLDQTTDSMFLGTPLYMAPEQAECRRELVGPASDVFALGVILHELATGARPFDGETLTAVLDQIRSVEPRQTAASRKLPRDLRRIISKCLQKEPSDRYRSAAALAEDLRSFASSRPIHAKRVSWRRRLWLWCSRPERITQAGAVTVAIQLAVLGNLYSHFILLGMGYRVPFEFNDWQFFKETIPVALFPHVPLLINGVRTIRFNRWSLRIGTGLSFAFVLLLAWVLIGGEPAFSTYDNNPFAAYVAHLFILCLAVIQLAVHLAAIPAAVKRHQPSVKRETPAKSADFV